MDFKINGNAHIGNFGERSFGLIFVCLTTHPIVRGRKNYQFSVKNFFFKKRPHRGLRNDLTPPPPTRFLRE